MKRAKRSDREADVEVSEPSLTVHRASLRPIAYLLLA
jgi:hypothetical protein